MTDFDYQWECLPDSKIELNRDRVEELLTLTQLPESFFKGKRCLDAGCGSGRYTYAMQELGAEVTSIDLSPRAIESVLCINKDVRVQDILTLEPNPIYDFVLSWGVLHHSRDPRDGFRRVASQVKPGGILHIMLYHKDTQYVYEFGRRIWPHLPYPGKVLYIRYRILRGGGTFHGWWDALNPTYNFSYDEDEVRGWFEEENFSDIYLTQKYSINMRGKKIADS